MNLPVRFAILGFGHHAIRRLVPAFVRSEHSVLTGIWRRNQEAAAKNCAEFNIPHCFATAKELCASPDVDVVFITSPDAMHRDDCLLAFAHGKAVLCEKPLAMNIDQANEIDSAARAAGVLFGVAQNFRFNRSIEWMQERVATGRIGKPQLAHAQFSYPAQTAPRTWITDPTLAVGGPIGDVAIHCIDALRFILGEDVESVSTLARKDALSGEVEAFATLQLEMTSGICANVMVNARTPYRTPIEVVGSEAAMIVEDAMTVDAPVHLIFKASNDVETETVDNSDGYVRMLDAFAQAYRGDGTYSANGEDALKNQRALDASYLSWRTGNRETV